MYWFQFFCFHPFSGIVDDHQYITIAHIPSNKLNGPHKIQTPFHGGFCLKWSHQFNHISLNQITRLLIIIIALVIMSNLSLNMVGQWYFVSKIFWTIMSIKTSPPPMPVHVTPLSIMGTSIKVKQWWRTWSCPNQRSCL